MTLWQNTNKMVWQCETALKVSEWLLSVLNTWCTSNKHFSPWTMTWVTLTENMDLTAVAAMATYDHKETFRMETTHQEQWCRKWETTHRTVMATLSTLDGTSRTWFHIRIQALHCYDLGFHYIQSVDRFSYICRLPQNFQSAMLPPVLTRE